jgi:small subunit ribosomal protein S4e
MTKNHLKARSAPRTWNIPRKENTFITRPNPGSQKLEMSFPLGNLLKNIGLGETTKEINYILRANPVLVNGVRRWDVRYNVGFQDVVSIPDAKKHVVLTLDEQGRLAAENVDEKHTSAKLAQVRGTSTVKGGKLQLHLSDGRNVLVEKPVKAGSTVTVSIPESKIKSVHAVEAKAHVILTSGKHRGSRGTIEAIDGEFVTVKTKEGSISTKKSYAFVLGGAQ